MAETGLSDFGGDSYRQGLDRLVDAARARGPSSPPWASRSWACGWACSWPTACGSRTSTAATRPSTTRSSTAPCSSSVSPARGRRRSASWSPLDPQIRSLRLWESSDPVPPPETATEDSDPRIAAAAAGLEAMYATFPRMASLYFQTATGPTECQDLLGMEFRTAHFDGMAHVPSYTDGFSTATWPRPTATTAGSSSFCSGTARPGSGT